jgi:hypothetical protein
MFSLISKKAEDFTLDREHLGIGNKNMPAAELRFADGSPVPEELKTSIWSCWNRIWLFIFFEGRYDSLRMIDGCNSSAPARMLELWDKSDVFEVFIGSDARRSFKYKEFQIAPDGHWLDIDVTKNPDGLKPDYSWSSGMAALSLIDGKKKIWRSGLAIPWQALGIMPQVGTSIDCNFYRASGEYHGAQLLSWSPTGYGNQCFHRPEHFGRLILTDHI